MLQKINNACAEALGTLGHIGRDTENGKLQL